MHRYYTTLLKMPYFSKEIEFLLRKTRIILTDNDNIWFCNFLNGFKRVLVKRFKTMKKLEIIASTHIKVDYHTKNKILKQKY